MNRSTLVKLFVAAAALASAAFLLIRGSGSDTSGSYSANHPYNSTMAHFVCLDQAEPHDFSMTLGEFASMTSRRVPVVCPTCGSDDISRATECPSCKANVPHGRAGVTPTNCAACGAEMPNGKADYFHAGTH